MQLPSWKPKHDFAIESAERQQFNVNPDSVQRALTNELAGVNRYFAFESFPTQYATDTDFTIGDIPIPVNMKLVLFEVSMYLEVNNPAAQLSRITFYYPSYNVNTGLRLYFTGNAPTHTFARPYILDGGADRRNYRITGRQYTGGLSAVCCTITYNLVETHR